MVDLERGGKLGCSRGSLLQFPDVEVSLRIEVDTGWILPESEIFVRMKEQWKFYNHEFSVSQSNQDLTTSRALISFLVVVSGFQACFGFQSIGKRVSCR